MERIGGITRFKECCFYWLYSVEYMCASERDRRRRIWANSGCARNISYVQCSHGIRFGSSGADVHLCIVPNLKSNSNIQVQASTIGIETRFKVKHKLQAILPSGCCLVGCVCIYRAPIWLGVYRYTDKLLLKCCGYLNFTALDHGIPTGSPLRC